MNCPYCKSKNLAQVWTRQVDATSTRRRRECGDCGGRFYTVETVEGRAPAPVAVKPRGPAGSRNTFSKLTEEQVVEMRRYAAAGAAREDLAERYGINKQTVSRIVNRRLWAHVA